jgi:hypothetical protein
LAEKASNEVGVLLQVVAFVLQQEKQNESVYVYVHIYLNGYVCNIKKERRAER